MNLTALHFNKPQRRLLILYYLAFMIVSLTIRSSAFQITNIASTLTKKFSKVGPMSTRNIISSTSLSLSTVSSAAASKANQNPNVAIIGAGAAGLVTARILSSKGFNTYVFEKEPRKVDKDDEINRGIGGVWSYSQNSKTKPMYKGLRTNLPRELMAYRSKEWGGDGTSMSFVTHSDVQQYLMEYMVENDLEQLINFDCNVKHMRVLNEGGGNDEKNSIDDDYPLVELEWESPTTKSINKQTFDAVCICNGHYSAPSSPPIQGLDTNFNGEAIHSIEYDKADKYQGKTVLCIGGRASGSDLAREISQYAEKVYLSDTSCPIGEDGEPIVEDNVHWVPKTVSVDENGNIHFEQPCKECPNDVDLIIFCSGYDYNFPFINDKSNLDLSVIPGERRVSPLYEQLWHAQYPNIAFVGLQHSVVPFPFFEFQAEAIAKQLTLRMFSDDDGNFSANEKLFKIPSSLEERMEAANRDANSGGPKENGRVQDTHFLGSFQWDACRTYAKFGGCYDENVENHIATNQAIYDHSNKARKDLFPGGPDIYRYNSYIRDDNNKSFICNPLAMNQEEEAVITR